LKILLAANIISSQASGGGVPPPPLNFLAAYQGSDRDPFTYLIVALFIG